MATIPGAQFSITGASGTQGLLAPKSGWFCYVFPRGGHASQDSTGATITFDSADVASRFAANNWIQVELDTANIRKVTGVGGNSITVQSSVTVSENDRVFLIGNTQPSITGGSATYITPATLIRQRDDDGSDLFTNSKVTSTSNGTIQFWAAPSVYDCIVQDGNQSIQGKIVDLPVGAVEGVSTDFPAVFGATATFLFGISGNRVLLLGGTASLYGALGVSGIVTTGVTVTMHGALGVTGTATFGATLTANAAFGVTGPATFGSTATFQGNMTGVSVTGSATFGNTATFQNVRTNRLIFNQSGPLKTISAGWGASASITTVNEQRDSCFSFYIQSAGAGQAANPTVSCNFLGGPWNADGNGYIAVTSRLKISGVGGDAQPTIPFYQQTPGAAGSTMTLVFGGTPVAGETYGCNVIVVGYSGAA